MSWKGNVRDINEGGFGSGMESKESFLVYFMMLVHHIATDLELV